MFTGHEARVLRIIPRDELDDLGTSLSNMGEKQRIEGPHARVGHAIAGHPTSPIESIEEIVHVTEADRRVLPKNIV